MAHYKFEYVWLDGWAPLPHIRSKTAIKELDSFDGDVDSLPEWSFDGSSTRQAEGHFSDCVLKPVRIYPDLQGMQHSRAIGKRGTGSEQTSIWL